MQPGDCFTIEVRALLCLVVIPPKKTENNHLTVIQPAVVQGTDPSGVTYPDEWTVSTEVEDGPTVCSF